MRFEDRRRGPARERMGSDVEILTHAPDPSIYPCMGVDHHDGSRYGTAGCWYPGSTTNRVIEPGWRVQYSVSYNYDGGEGLEKSIEVRGPCGVVHAYNGGDQFMFPPYDANLASAWLIDMPSNACLGDYVFTATVTELTSRNFDRESIYFKVGYGTPPSVTEEATRVPCGQTSARINPTACGGDPVNTATGAFMTGATDLKLPGIGVPFDLGRTYTSSDATEGALGVGWTHSYEASLTIQSTGNVVLRTETGQKVLYTKSGTSFVGPAGTLYSLHADSAGYRLVTPAQITYGFDLQGRLVSKTDRNGNGLSFSYGSGSGPATVTDRAGRTFTLTYDATSGRLSSVGAPDGRSVSYGYTNGRLSRVTDVRGNDTLYSYDTNGLLTDIVDQNGNRMVHNVYGTDGRVVEQTDSRGNITTFDWDAATQTSTMVDPRGSTWKDVYSNNVLAKRVDPLGNATSYYYNERLDLRAIEDPRGNRTTMTYDSNHNLLTITAPNNIRSESFAYNERNDVTSYRDGRGVVTNFGYDTAGNLASVSLGGGTTSFVRDPATALPTSSTDPRGKITNYEHDAAGSLTKITSPLGNVATIVYDAAGRPTSVVEPRGNVSGAVAADFETRFTYDAANHLTSHRDPLGHVTAWAYDKAGNLQTETDAKNRVTRYGYNPAYQMTSVTAPDLSVTAYAYDKNGNLASRTDAKSHSTTYDYDPANRLSRVTSPLGSTCTYEYDASGNVVRVTDANGAVTATAGDGTTSYSYDALNRVKTVDYSDATPDIALTYDGADFITQMIDGTGTQTFAYTELGRIRSAARGSESFTHAYDLAGNLTQSTYPDGRTISYTYDDDSRLSSVVADSATTSYGYDAAGNVTSTTLPSTNGHVEQVTYDRAGRLTELKNVKGTAVLSKATLVLDAVGNPLSRTGVSGVQTYKYDDLDRLTEVCFQQTCTGASDPFIRYAYDTVGNRLSEAKPAGTTTNSYNAADQLTGSTGLGGTVTYSYDANGNMLSNGAKAYTYDLADRMRTAKIGTTTTTYAYDGFGNRFSATSGNSTTKFYWDIASGLPELTAEKVGNSFTRSYTYGHDLISMVQSRATHYFHRDALGSIVNVTNSSGVPQWSYDYEPFGNVRTETKHNTKAPANFMKFTGEYQDPTGLYHLRARQYDPTIGRFTATDPMSPSMSDPFVSAYAYVNNQPTVYVDPTGEIAWFAAPLVWKVGAAALASLAGAYALQDPDVRDRAAYATQSMFTTLVDGVTNSISGASTLPALGEFEVCDGWAQGAFAKDMERNPGPDALNEVVQRNQSEAGNGGNPFGNVSERCRRNRAVCAAIAGTTAAAFGVHETAPRKPGP